MRILPAMLLLAACGPDLRGPEDPTVTTPATAPTGEAQPAARYLPEVCGVQSWAGVTPTDLSMSVVTSDQGAVIFGVPKTGGSVMGYSIDSQGKMDTAGVPIATNAQFTSVSATRIDGQYAVAAVSGEDTMMNLVSMDLGQVDQLLKLQGNLLGTNAIVTTRQNHLAATAGPAGLMLSTFDGTWQTLSTKQFPIGVVGMDAATYGEDALVAWSTQTDCAVQEVAVPKLAIGLFGCHSPRLAVGWGDRAELAYVTPEGVHVGDIYMSGQNAIASTHLVGARGTSPRIVFDGTRYWMSYVDARGGVAVGYLSEDFGTLVSLALEDVTPSADAYDLKIVNGQPTVFSASARGYAAHTLCLTH